MNVYESIEDPFRKSNRLLPKLNFLQDGRGLLSRSTPRVPQLLHCLDERPRFLHGPLFPLSPEHRRQSVLALEVLELRGLQPAEDRHVGRCQLRGK